MPRRVALALLPCAALLAWSPRAEARNPIPGTPSVEELVHEIEVELAPEGATLQVTRSLTNPSLFHARVDLPIPVPCEATLDQLAVEERGPEGFARWRAAELIDPAEAEQRFDLHLAGPTAPGVEVAADSDTAVLLSRSESWDCGAELSLYPIPPLETRTVSYRVFVPSSYDDGRYAIELPKLVSMGETPTLVVAGFAGSDFTVSIGGRELDSGGASLDGGAKHPITLTPRDDGRGRVHAVDLDLAALIAQTPAARALLEAEPDAEPDAAAGPPSRLLEARFEAPAELAQLPPIRRAVIVLDASRSLSSYAREQLQRLGAAYLEALEQERAGARVELLLFDREVRRVYHDFVPAAWGAADLAKLDVEDGNGSELGVALASARELLVDAREDEPRDAVAGADWIIVLSDLDLRSDFDLAAERAAAADSSVRMHVVHHVAGKGTFFPAEADASWTAIARAAGGMAWDTDGSGSHFADELVSPRRIWKLGLELELADGGHRSEALDPWLLAGAPRQWSDHQHAGAALVRAAYVGEVWGQARAWTASPSELETRRTAGALATHDPEDRLSKATRAALAYYAGVVSPFSSAWALAHFDGAAPAPLERFGSFYGVGSSHGCSLSCGGATSCRAGVAPNALSFAELAQRALSSCKIKGDGSYVFETTDDEIVAVDSSNRCLAMQTWATDISPVRSRGRKRVTVSYARGWVTTATPTTL